MEFLEYGNHQLTFDPDEHKYWLDQDELLSVTTYLKLAGYVRPYHGEGEAAYIGRQAHAATRLLDYGILDWSRLDPKLVGFVRCWDRFKQEQGFVPDLTWRERPTFHPIYRWAGTPDVPGMLKNQPCVMELKTGHPEPWHHLQVKGGYAPMIAAHDARYKDAISALVYLHEDDAPATLTVVKGARLDLLFASLVACVNGRDFYGNNGRIGT